jgi:uncharacterized protein YggE
MVTPDILVWDITLKNSGSNKKEVAKYHTKVVKDVMELLDDKNVPSGDIQSTRMQLGEFTEDRGTSDAKTRYYASSKVNFMIRDLNKYESIWLELADFDSVESMSVDYSLSNRISYQDETRQRALRAAREKAEAMANTMNAKIIKPLLVEEIQSSYSGNPTTINDIRNQDDFNDMKGAPGKIAIRARIKVTFELISTMW